MVLVGVWTYAYKMSERLKTIGQRTDNRESARCLLERRHIKYVLVQ